MTERKRPPENTDPYRDAALSGLEARIRAERTRRDRIVRANFERTQSNLKPSPHDAVERIKIANAAARAEWLKAAETDKGRELRALGLAFAKKAQQARVQTQSIKVVVATETSVSFFGKRPTQKLARGVFPGWVVLGWSQEIGGSVSYDGNDNQVYSGLEGFDGISVLTDGRIVFKDKNTARETALFDTNAPFNPRFLEPDYPSIFAKFLVDHGA